MYVRDGIDGCCSAVLFHHLDFINKSDVAYQIREAALNGSKLIYAITGDTQKKAVRILTAAGFKKSPRMTNPSAEYPNRGITLWYRSCRITDKKKKSKARKAK